MAQQQSPFLEVAYGWDYGENNWNTGIDQNQLKFSYMFDRNIDGIVASLPSTVNGQAYFLTSDNRIYFAVGGTYYSTPCPKWFVVVLRSTGQTYQFNGSSLVSIETSANLTSRLNSVQLTLDSLGTAAFKPQEYFASKAQLDVVSAQSNSYTDTLRQNLSGTTGTSFVSGGNFDLANSKLSEFISSQSRTIASLFSDSIRIDKGFSTLTPNDSSKDYSSDLNNIFQIAAALGIPIDGYGAKFYVRNPVKIFKGLKLRRITFESLGAPAGDTSAKSHIPVVTWVGTEADPCSGWWLEDVVANGRRDLWPNIAMITPGPEGGGGEDGGMHAFRMAGFCNTGVMLNCSGINAGTAGLAITNPTPSSTTAIYAKRNIQIINFTATGNREHGWFLDSAEDIVISGRFTGNGLDLNTTDPLVHGNRGARNAGTLFGSPFDIESYSGAPGSQFRNITVKDWRGTDNAMMPLVYSPVSMTAPGYVEATNIRLINFVSDSGLAAGADRAAGFDGVGLYVLANPTVGSWGLSGLIVDGYINGRPEYIGVNNIDNSSGYIRSTVTKAILNNCGPACNVSAASNANRLQIFPVPAVVITKTSGTAAATITSTYQFTRPLPQARIENYYSISMSGALSAGGVLSASVAPPSGYIIADMRFEALADTLQPIAVSARVDHSAGNGTLFINTAMGSPSTGNLVVVLTATS